jgi:hypothetical protein
MFQDFKEHIHQH